MTLLVIVADTRVGSTALGLGFSSQDGTNFLGEILYPEVSTTPAEHLYGRIIGMSVTQLLDRRSLFAVLDEFFLPLEQNPNYNIVDLKYHDFGLFPHHPRSIAAVPILADYLLDREFKIIHLNRRNKVAAVISESLANKIKVHHQKAGGAAAEQIVEIELSCFDTIASTLQRIDAHWRFRHWLRNARDLLEIDYEAIFFDETGPAELLAHMREVWQWSGFGFSVVTARVSSTYKPKITNLQSLLELVQGTEFEIDFAEIALQTGNGHFHEGKVK